MARSVLYDFTPSELQNLLDTSNSYSDLLRKVGLNPKGGNPETLKRIIEEYGLNTTQLDLNRKKLYSRCAYNTHFKITTDLNDILEGKIVYKSSHTLLQRLFNNGLKEHKCEICGITEWQGKPLSFQLHHIDGDHLNNKWENLQVLCPNCHSQTDTYAGKSKKKIKKVIKEITKIKSIKLPPISRIELKEKIRSETFVSIAGEYGVSDNTIRKWCKKYHLPSKKFVIKTYSDEEWENV